ncbi:phytoene desaturase family protein [Blastochloris viridis]|uniref:Phytoene dehydrogenase n=1 Tax=Blastochloris viridis TaxID=1079 RepID=A0A182D409_BLAVI|nr:phytoene desaturase family protein [Blastochloris viridis]ALK09913.1 Phytoene desaturase (neurosporene-forming) [Blastochloris viridis]BAS00180.1 phytoene dehydrogenase [Blastochloris viridis]
MTVVPNFHLLAVEPDHRPHAVIIGAGFGGLGAAVRLGARGYRVTVVDRLGGPGGRGRGFQQDGYTFDAGPTLVTAPHMFEELWELCGKKMSDHVAMVAMDPFYRVIFSDGSTFEASQHTEKVRAQIAKLAPADLAGWDRYMARGEASLRDVYQRVHDTPFRSIWDMSIVLGGLVRLEAYHTVYGLVSRFVKDERLRQVLSFHQLFIGGNPFAASAFYSLITHLEKKWGVHFAIGGTSSLADGLAALIRAQGGVLRFSEDVTEITLDGRRATGVKLASGETIAADVVVSNADSAFTYGRLLPSHACRRWNARKLDRARYSMSVFLWYFGTSRQWPEVPHHTILMGPRYRELIRDIFVKKVLAPDFSLYLHRPTATDPSMAPAGCDSFYVLSPVPNLQGDADWTKVAEPYRRAIEDKLDTMLLPGLKGSVVTSRVVTPLHFRDTLLSPHGAGFGLEPVLTQSVYFRPHNCSEDIDGLYLVGAGTHPGAGLPAVLASAKILDKVVPDARQLARL